MNDDGDRAVVLGRACGLVAARVLADATAKSRCRAGRVWPPASRAPSRVPPATRLSGRARSQISGCSLGHHELMGQGAPRDALT